MPTPRSTSTGSDRNQHPQHPHQPPKIKRALLYVTSWVEPTMLSAYKFYVDGALVSLGPGRGEANVMQHNNTFLHAPYTTVDLSGHGLQYGTVLAMEGMAPLYQAPCNLHVCKDPNTDGGGVLAQLVLTFSDGTCKNHP